MGPRDLCACDGAPSESDEAGSAQCERPRWQKNEFRCSFGGCIGNETSFSAVRSPPIPAIDGIACVFRCKNNGKSNLAKPFWRPCGQNGESEPRSATIAAPKPVCLPSGPTRVHRNPFACQMECGRYTETRPAAIRPAEAAQGLAWPPSARQSQAPRNSFGGTDSASLSQKPPWNRTSPCLGLPRA